MQLHRFNPRDVCCVLCGLQQRYTSMLTGRRDVLGGAMPQHWFAPRIRSAADSLLTTETQGKQHTTQNRRQETAKGLCRSPGLLLLLSIWAVKVVLSTLLLRGFFFLILGTVFEKNVFYFTGYLMTGMYTIHCGCRNVRRTSKKHFADIV